jgi:hypothetical protein
VQVEPLGIKSFDQKAKLGILHRRYGMDKGNCEVVVRLEVFKLAEALIAIQFGESGYKESDGPKLKWLNLGDFVSPRMTFASMGRNRRYNSAHISLFVEKGVMLHIWKPLFRSRCNGLMVDLPAMAVVELRQKRVIKALSCG